MDKVIPCFYSDYGRYITRFRAFSFEIDCLKFVERRLLMSLYDVAKGRKPVKSARVIGHCVGQYHPHGDQSAYKTLAQLVNRGFADGEGNWGSRGLVEDDPPAAMRYCVVGDTRIDCEMGLSKIKNISQSNNEDINVHVSSYNGDINKSSKWFDCGKFPIISIEVDFGYSLKGSTNHLVLTFNKKCQLEWKTFEKIDIDDCVILKKGTNFNTTDIDNNIFVILGCLLSEGWYHSTQNKIGFNNTDFEYTNHLTKSLDNLSIEYGLYESVLKSGKPLKQIEVFKKSEVQKLLNIGVDTSKSKFKTIPEIVWKSSKNNQSTFLKYLFTGDGSVMFGKRNILQIQYTSVSHNLLKEIQTLLIMRFGIVSKLVLSENKLVIQGITNCKIFYDQIGFTGVKQAKLKVFLDNFDEITPKAKSDRIPYLREYILNKYKIPREYNQTLNKNTWTTYQTLPNYLNILFKFIDETDKQLIMFLLQQQYIFLNVKTKQILPEENVYSLRVDSDCHSFITDGFISHNTEVKLAPWVKELAFKYIDYVPWENFEYENEPTILPCPVPIGLVGQGIDTGIAFHRSLIPRYSLKDLAIRLTWLLENGLVIDDVDKFSADESRFGPKIIPNIEDCDVQEDGQNQFYKILIEGVGRIKAIPYGKIDKNEIFIYGRAPLNTFKSLINAADKSNKKSTLDIDMVDSSTKTIEIVITTKKKANTTKIASTIWDKFLIKNYNITNLVSNKNGNVVEEGIDDLLLRNFNSWRQARFSKRYEDCENLIQKRFDADVILIIRNIIQQHQCTSVDQIKQIFNSGQQQVSQSIRYDGTQNTWVQYNRNIAEEDVEKACQKSIKRLVEVSIDINQLNTDVNAAITKLSSLDVDCLNDIKSLR